MKNQNRSTMQDPVASLSNNALEKLELILFNCDILDLWPYYLMVDGILHD